MSGIAAFLNGLVDGRERRRKWDTENEDREWEKNRRGRQLVLDEQQDEDRLSDNAWEVEDRGNSRTTWGREAQRHGRQLVLDDQEDADRATRLSDEAYDRTRTRAADGREDETRRVIADGWTAAEEAYRAQETAAPVSSAPAAAAVPPAPAPAAVPRSLPPNPLAAGASAPATARAPLVPSAGIDTAPGGLPMPVVPPSAAGAALPPTGAPVAPVTTQPLPPAAAPAAAAPAAQAPATPATARALPVSTEPEARIAQRAEAASKSLMQHFREEQAPKIMGAYMKAGDTAKAEAFDKFLQTGQTQEAMGHWSKAVARAQMGDHRGFADAMASAYNVRGYYDDGIIALPDRTVIEQDPQTGQLRGVVVFQDEATGREFEMPFEGLDDLYRAGIGMLAPEQVFEKGYAQVTAADERRAARVDEATPKAEDANKEPDQILKVYEGIQKRESDMASPRAGPDGKPLPPMTPAEMMEEARATVAAAKGRGQAAPAAPAGEGVPVFLR